MDARCCTHSYDLGCTPCGTVAVFLPVNAAMDGTYVATFNYLGFPTTFSFEGVTGEPLRIPLTGLNENFTHSFSVEDPNGDRVMLDDNDCFRLRIIPGTVGEEDMVPLAAVTCENLLDPVSGLTLAQKETCVLPSIEMDDAPLTVQQVADLVERLCTAGGDVTIRLKDEDGTTLSTVVFACGGDEVIVAPNATAVLKDTAGAPLSITAIPSGTSADLVAPNASAVVRNSVPTTLSTNPLKSGETLNIAVADSVITKPDATTANLPATVALDVRNYRSGIVYQRGRSSWSGQTTVYTAGDEGTLLAAGWFDDVRPVYPTHYANISSWLVLTVNNIHGNTNRFTAPDGTQTYTDRIIQDHLTGYEWYVPSPPSTGTFGAAIAAALALNYGGNTDWKIPPLNVLQTIVDTRPAVILNYAPFNVSPQTIWSSTTNPATTGAAIPVLANATSQSTAKVTATVGYFYVRKFV